MGIAFDSKFAPAQMGREESGGFTVRVLPKECRIATPIEPCGHHHPQNPQEILNALDGFVRSMTATDPDPDEANTGEIVRLDMEDILSDSEL